MSALVYNTGTVIVTQNSVTVIGVGTKWITNVANLMLFSTDGLTAINIEQVISDTQLQLYVPYPGVSASKIAYTIAAYASPTATSLPRDWTNGTGVFPPSGEIDIPAPQTLRSSLFIQGYGVNPINIDLEAIFGDGSSGFTRVTPLVSPLGAGNGGQPFQYDTVPPWQGIIRVSGDAGSQVVVTDSVQ